MSKPARQDLTVHAEAPALGLLSFCPRSLELLLYLRVAKVPYKLSESSYPYCSIRGALPTLRWGGWATGAGDSLEFVRKNFCDIDQHLSVSQKADHRAYQSFVAHQLLPVTLFLKWASDKRCEQVTALEYAKGCPALLRWRFRKAERAQALSALDQSSLSTLAQVRARMRSVLESLRDRLKGNMYFSREPRACSLDCTAAAYVGILYFFSDNTFVNPLRKMLDEEFPRLVRHCQRLFSSLDASFLPDCEFKSSDSLEPSAPLKKSPPAPGYPPANYYPHQPLGTAATADPPASKAARAEEQRLRTNYKFMLGGVGLMIAAAVFFRGDTSSKQAAAGKS